MKTIKLVAIDVDGVLVEDIFSLITPSFVSQYNIKYTRELERKTFSRPQKEAAEYLANLINEDSETLIKNYFKERKKFLKIHGCGLLDGVPEFLKRLPNLDVRFVCYGGLPEEDIPDTFKEYLHYFERYICTNDFRPGIKEITNDIYGLEYNQVLFIDDVNTVAEIAKATNTPFIGIPGNFPWGFQRQDMIATKVKYLLNSIKDIDIELLEKIDFDVSVGTIWG